MQLGAMTWSILVGEIMKMYNNFCLHPIKLRILNSRINFSLYHDRVGESALL
jgi:hypothetical protein